MFLECVYSTIASASVLVASASIIIDFCQAYSGVLFFEQLVVLVLVWLLLHEMNPHRM